MNKIILTFDIEFDKDEFFSEKSQETLFLILDLLKKNKHKATFFVVGKLIEKNPELIKRIFSEGHEIACHGYSHVRLDNFSPQAFEKELKKSIESTKSIIGKPLFGFRAPYFSINKKTKWVLEILERLGFLYDSSVFPMKTLVYGESKAPLAIYPVSVKDFAKKDESSKLTEVPVSIFKLGPIKFPASGGVYFRLIPFWILKRLLQRIQKSRQAVIYLHIHDLHESGIRPPGNFLLRKIRSYGRKKGLAKFKLLLQIFQFDSVENVLFYDNKFTSKRG
ncbi:MAG: polysaccharide deacetylase family protein [Candidatus Nealsonbacteria bacterium]